MELVVHTHNEAADPFTFIVKAWATLCAIDEFREKPSDFDWGSAGLLPVLRCEGQVYTRNHVLDFLKLAYDLNKDLESNERLEAVLLEELVYSRLHPATQYAVCVEGYKVPVGEGWSHKLINWPTNTVRSLATKASMKAALHHQHYIQSSEAALHHADSVHQRLSERLGSSLFFFSKPGRPEYPRSTDIVVYAFLLEEKTCLQSHPHLTESLAKYPNLEAFADRMHKILHERSSSSPDSSLSSLLASPPKHPEVSVYYPPQIHFCRDALGSSKNFCYLSGHSPPTLRQGDIEHRRRRIYVTGVIGVLFSFFLLKSHLA
jgi:hypothetical protein